MNCRLMLAVLLIVIPARLDAQRGATQPPPAPRQAAPIDVTGYWVSIITDDWRFRMLTPPKGDYLAISLSPEGRKIADSWDPSRDEAAGNQCKAYGAAGIMRLPGRLHISWEGDNTLRIDVDTGTQTRRLLFGASAPRSGPSLQGYSSAAWDFAGGRGADSDQARGGQLKVVTTNMLPGYLRKNGVPYSGNAVLTEYFNRITESNGDQYLIVTTIVEDPLYLTQPLVRSSYFKREPDGSKWNPSPCSAR